MMADEKMPPRETIARDASKLFGSSSPASLYEFAKIHNGSYTDPKLNAEMAKILKEAAPETKKESVRGEKQLRDLVDREGFSRSTSGKLSSKGGGGGMKPDTDITASRKLPKMAKGGMVKSSASKRGDGCAQRGHTKGRMV
jgi:hypothetical protein